MLSQHVVSTTPSRSLATTVSNAAFAKLQMLACMRASAVSKLVSFSSGSMRTMRAPIDSSASTGTYLQA